MNRSRFESLEAARGIEPTDSARIAAATEQEEDRWRRARSVGIIGTAILHFLLFILFREAIVPPPSTSAAAGPAAGDLRAAAGGSGLTMVEVRTARPPEPVEVEEEPEPIPEPVPEEPVVEIPEEIEVPTTVPEPAPAAEISAPGTGGPGQGGDAQGPEIGPGLAAGSGDGGGGDSDGGEARIIPPTPRGVFIPPPGRPESARGQQITVWVLVTEAGRVDRNSIRLEPPTSDSRYNRQLIQSVAEWVFDPARQGGRPVSVWYPFQIIL